MQTKSPQTPKKAPPPPLKVRTQIKAGYYLGLVLRGGGGTG